jgi:hypothetical protein
MKRTKHGFFFGRSLVNRDRGLVGDLPLLHDGVALQPEDPSATTPLIGDVHAHNCAVQVGLKKRSILFHFERDHEFFDSNRPRIIHTFEPSYFVDRVSLTSGRYDGALPSGFLPQY